MKKVFYLLLLALLDISQMVAQGYDDYEYVPFVREGVKWVYLYEEQFNPFVDNQIYLNLELKGDTVINCKTYKLMHKYHGESINTENDTVPVCLREEDKVVYAFVPNGVLYDDCPVGKPSDNAAIREGREFVLYDFNNPIGQSLALADSLDTDFEHLYTDIIKVGNHHVKRYGVYMEPFGGITIVEGVGMETWNSTPLSFYRDMMYGFPYFHLSRVIENDEVIYTPRSHEEPSYPGGFGYEYVPFVREGVKWIYYYNNPFHQEILDMDEGIQYYSFEMKGDVEIGGKHYKPVVLTHFLDKDGKGSEVEAFTPVYLREENKVVYAIQPGGINHPQCPVGICQNVSASFDENTGMTEETVLYDFNDPITLYDMDNPTGIEYMETDYVKVGTSDRKRHHYKTYLSDNDVIVEGVGFDGAIFGMPLFYFMPFVTGMQVGYYFSHVVENGEITYKGLRFNPDAVTILPGDVNGDGEITIADANGVIDIVVMGGNPSHPRVPSGSSKDPADLNGDGEVNIADVNAIIDLIVNDK